MTTAAEAGAISIDRREGVWGICIDRPGKKNALTIAMYSALEEAFLRADADASVRVILIKGAEGCFTSGNDLADFMNSPPEGESSPVFRFLATISQVEKPIVAAVQGPAVGIGVTMLLHCDLVYAGQSARFLLPFVNLGLCPEAASSFLLPRLSGHQRAAEVLLLGEPFSAEKAREMGIVNAVCPDDTVLEIAMTQAARLASQPPASVRLTKALMKKPWTSAVKEAMSEEGRLFIERLASPEASEGIKAFFERRKPDYSRFQ